VSNENQFFSIRNVLKQGEALSPLLFNFAVEYALGGFRQTRRAWNQMVHIMCWYMLMMSICWAEG